MDFSKDYWQERWETNQTGWDIGHPSTPLVNYIDKIQNKDLKILVPGAGNAYEGEYLHEQGFKNAFILDIAPQAVENLQTRKSSIPRDRIILGDFFEHRENYDLILEQTFFCALDPSLRTDYVEKMYQLLNPGGKLAGLLFNAELFKDHPPFGGFREEYLPLFEKKFKINQFELAPDSIKPRLGRELFIEVVKEN